MAKKNNEFKDLINDAGKVADEVRDMNSALTSVSANIQQAVSQTQFLDAAAKKTAKSFERDLVGALKAVAKSNTDIGVLQKKMLEGTKLDASERRKLGVLLKRQQYDQAKAMEAANQLRKEGVDINIEDEAVMGERLDNAQELGKEAKNLNDKQILQKGLLKNILISMGGIAGAFGKSGLGAALMNKEVSGTQKLLALSEISFKYILQAILRASANVTKLQKALGISKDNAKDLQQSFLLIQLSSEKAYISSLRLNEAFTALSSQTGLVADFSDDTLENFVFLTKQLGMSNDQATKMTMLFALTGKSSDEIYSNIDDTVNAFNKQNKTGISLRAIYKDIASASASMVVSLGKSPELLTQAALQAERLGLSLSSTEQIMDGLLNFEKSIESELAFQLVTGREINLNRARGLALANDYEGVLKEVGKNEEILLAFQTDNRVAQQLAADALNLSKEQLAEMVLKSEYQNLLKDDFVAKYGEQNYLAMEELSVQEEMNMALEKMQAALGDLAIKALPIVEAITEMLSSTKALKIVLGAIIGLSFAKMIGSLVSLIISLSTATSLSIGLASALTFGVAAAAIIAGGMAMNAMIDDIEEKQSSKVNGIKVEDFTISTHPKDTLVMAGGTKLGVNGGDDQYSRDVLEYLKTIAMKESRIYMGSEEVGTAFAKDYSGLG